MDSKDVSQLLIGIFTNLNKNDVNYCVLRNYEELPYFVGHDVDILLREEDKDAFDEVISSTIECLEWKRIYTRNKYKFYTLILYKVENNNVHLLKLDLWTELSWRGVPWIDSHYVLSNTEKYKDFYIPRKGAEAAITALKELTGGGNVPEKYYDKIKKLSLEDKEGFYRSLEPIFGNYAEDLYLAVSIGKWSFIDDFKKEIKKKIFSNLNSRKRLSNIIEFSKHEIRRRITNLIYPKGGLIAFIGPDGSGKSTLIDLVNSRLEVFYPKRHKYHMRFRFFPEIKTNLGLTSVKQEVKVSDNIKSIEKGHQRLSSKPSLIRYVASWTVVIYYTLEFLLGNLKVWKISSRSELILFDRYYYDYFVQPSYRNLIWPLRKLLLFMVPSPKAAIYLKADPEIVFKRKGELNPAEIKIQNEYFTRILSDVRNSYIINTDDKTLEEVEAQACQIIIDNLKLNKS